ncbi:protein modification by small protein conjugation or removal [Coemansia interrupta]|uniref:Protein modification by small protein conjugation or removal n=1 Tax=Coemansia interrupta TaxID=1126814 RepID=A0A9W8LN31_9FUNG|nr:protein modification by small protein conjugation or removal [Coemansia interrupta]
MSTPANSKTEEEAGTDSLLGRGGGRTTTVDFGELRPQYHAPMMFPNEVELYEPTLRLAADGGGAAAADGVRTVQTQVDVALPCGYFNIWRPLHPRQAAISGRMQRFMVGAEAAAAAAGDSAGGPAAWTSRVSYSSADDEYFQNGVALAFVKGWQRGALHAHNVFRKVEHDWGTTYLAPMETVGRGGQARGIGDSAVVLWRFNYAESHGVVDALHVRAGFAVFSEQAAVRWHIRRLDRLAFERVAVHELTADELASFPEAADSGVEATSEGAAQRARIVERHRGCMLAYRVHGDEHNAYALLSLPGFAADLSRHVAGAYGFELAAELQPAREGADRWQKAQVARQSLLQPVNGRMREGEAAMERCGLDVRVRLRPDVAVDGAPAAAAAGVCMDDASSDFVVHVADPSNTVGSLQPPVRAHARVLAAGSDYFAALLASAMSETAARSVALEDMPYGAARVALSFLYTGAVADADARSLDGWLVLLAVAARLAIPRLHQLCQARILRHAVAAVAADADADADAAAPDASVERRLRPAAAALFERLHAAAAENGADALADALDRIVDNYAVACQEHAMRCGETAPYAPPPAGPRHHHADLDPAHDHLFLVPGMLVRHGVHAGHEDDEEDGDDDEDGDGGEHRHRANAQGFFARMFGHGWHVTNVGAERHEPEHEPPQPQPGPVPHAETHAETQSDAGSDAPSET